MRKGKVSIWQDVDHDIRVIVSNIGCQARVRERLTSAPLRRRWHTAKQDRLGSFSSPTSWLRDARPSSISTSALATDYQEEKLKKKQASSSKGLDPCLEVVANASSGNGKGWRLGRIFKRCPPSRKVFLEHAGGENCLNCSSSVSYRPARDV